MKDIVKCKLKDINLYLHEGVNRFEFTDYLNAKVTFELSRTAEQKHEA